MRRNFLTIVMAVLGGFGSGMADHMIGPHRHVGGPDHPSAMQEANAHAIPFILGVFVLGGLAAAAVPVKHHRR